MELADRFDGIILNDDLEKAVEEALEQVREFSSNEKDRPVLRFIQPGTHRTYGHCRTFSSTSLWTRSGWW